MEFSSVGFYFPNVHADFVYSWQVHDCLLIFCRQHRADRQMWNGRLAKAQKQKAAAQQQKTPEEQEDLPIR